MLNQWSVEQTIPDEGTKTVYIGDIGGAIKFGKDVIDAFAHLLPISRRSAFSIWKHREEIRFTIGSRAGYVYKLMPPNDELIIRDLVKELKSATWDFPTLCCTTDALLVKYPSETSAIELTRQAIRRYHEGTR